MTRSGMRMMLVALTGLAAAMLGRLPAAEAARLTTVGFEFTAVADGDEVFDFTGGATLSGAAARTGTYGLLTSAAASTATAYVKFADSNATSGIYYFRTYLRVPTGGSPTSLLPIIMLQPSAGGQKAMIKMNTTRTLELWNDEDNVQIGSDSSALNLDQWYRIELKCDLTGGISNASLEARIDGVVFASGTANFNDGIVDLRLGPSDASSTITLHFDDVAINDATGSVQTGYPGLGSVVYLWPNEAGDSNVWLHKDNSAGSSTNYMEVDETAPDDPSTYVKTSANADDLYGIENLSTEIGATSAVVNVVHVGFRHQNATLASRSLKLLLKSGGTTYASSAMAMTNTGFRTNKQEAANQQMNYGLTCTTQPASASDCATGTGWTVSAVDALQAGLRDDDGVSLVTHVTMVWVVVEYARSVTLGSSVKATSLTLSDRVLTLGSNTLTLTGSGTPLTNSGGSETFVSTGSTVVFTSGSGATVAAASAPYHHLQINGTGTFTASGALTVGGNLTVTSGTLKNGGSSAVTGDVVVTGGLSLNNNNLTISGGDLVGTGTVYCGDGAHSCSAGTVTLDGTGNLHGTSAASCASPGTTFSFYNLTLGDGSGSATTSLCDYTRIFHTLKVDTSQTFALQAVNIDIGTPGANGHIVGAGAITNGGGGTTLLMGTGNLGGTSSTTPGTCGGTNGSYAFYQLLLGDALTARTTSLCGSITAAYRLHVRSSHILDGKSYTITLSGSGGDGSPFDFDSGDQFTESSSTVTYSGTYGGGNMTVNAATSYRQLQLIGADTYVPSTHLTVTATGSQDALFVGAAGGTTLDLTASNYNLTVTGGATLGGGAGAPGTLVARGSTVSMGGTLYLDGGTLDATPANGACTISVDVVGVTAAANNSWIDGTNPLTMTGGGDDQGLWTDAFSGQLNIGDVILDGNFYIWGTGVKVKTLTVNASKWFSLLNFNLTVTDGSISGAGTIYCFNVNNDCTAGTTLVDGTGSIDGGTYTFYDLTLGDGSGATTTTLADGTYAVINNLTVASNQTLLLNQTSTPVVTGDVAVNSSAVLSLNGKSLTVNGGAFSGSGNVYCGNGNNTCAAGTVVLSGTGTLGGGEFTFYNLHMMGGSSTTTFGGAITVKGNAHCGLSTAHTCTTAGYAYTVENTMFAYGDGITDAVVNMDGSTVTFSRANNTNFWLFNFLDGTQKGTLNAGSASITFAGIDVTWAPFDTNGVGTFNAESSTVTYTGNDAASTVVIRGMTYNHLVFNRSGETFVPDAALAVTGNLTVTSGTLKSGGTITVTGDTTVNGALSLNGNSLTVNGGDFVGSGTVYCGDGNNTCSAGTVTLDAAGYLRSTVTGSCTTPGTGDFTFYNLTAGDGSGTTTTTLCGGLTVLNALTVATSQTLALQDNNVGIGTASGNGHIVGGGIITSSASGGTLTLLGNGNLGGTSSAAAGTCSGTNGAYTFYNLTAGDGSTAKTTYACGNFTVSNRLYLRTNHTLDGNTAIITVSGTGGDGSPFDFESGDPFLEDASTLRYTGVYGSGNMLVNTATSYSGLHLLGVETYEPTGNLTVTSASNTALFVAAFGGATLDLTASNYSLSVTNGGAYLGAVGFGSCGTLVARGSTVTIGGALTLDCGSVDASPANGAASITADSLTITVYVGNSWTDGTNPLVLNGGGDGVGAWSDSKAVKLDVGDVTIDGAITLSTSAKATTLDINATKSLSLNAKDLTVTGGTISDTGTIYCGAGNNTCAAGTLTVTGTGNIGGGTYTFYNVTASGTTLTAAGHLTVNGTLTAQAGTFEVSTYTVTAANATVSGGTLSLTGSGGKLKLSGGGTLAMTSGTLTASDVATAPELTTSDTVTPTYVAVNLTGGVLNVAELSVDYLTSAGFRIGSGVTLTALNKVTWGANGQTGGTDVMLDVTSQTANLTNHVFPASWSGGDCNVRANTSGTVTMFDWSGAYGGEDYDCDNSGEVVWQGLAPQGGSGNSGYPAVY